MQNSTHKLLMLMVLMAVAATAAARVAAANPVIKPQSQRGIIFPTESFDDCFVDKMRRVPGTCKLLLDCPAALELWDREHITPKTCFFVKFDQYVCCAHSEDITSTTTTTTTTTTASTTTTTTTTTTYAPFILRRSEEICEDARPFGVTIVNGEPTSPREFPFMAALGWPTNYDTNAYYRCGGSLISPTFVLTAAHCISFGGQLPTTVRVGGDNITLSTGEDRQIRRVFTHPNYNDSTAYDDIALLELDTPINLTFACLCQMAELSASNVTAIGYGQIQFAGVSSSQLLKVSLQHVSNEQCQPHYSSDVLTNGLAESQLCAGDAVGMGDTCQGDSGGPLLQQIDSMWYVVGITSLGQGCANGPPSIYTRVSSYLDWIESIVWPNAGAQAQQPTFDLRVSNVTLTAIKSII